MEADHVGEIIAGRYECAAVLGRGGQGVVCRARDLETGDDVAVKIVASRVARQSDATERLAREQQALQALAGTNAVKYLDMCRASDGALCLVMELLDGQEFERHLVSIENRGEQLSVDTLIEVLDPIVSTLDKAHAVGIVHRDLKPGNIFVMSQAAGGGARLLDFGFARLHDSKRVTDTGMVMGSPSYIAPEMWKGQAQTADHRVDVYAFGVIVYRALSGQLPFSNASMSETLIAVTTKPRPSLHALRRDLPEAVDEWVKHALAIDPGARFPSVGASYRHLLWALDRGPRPAKTKTGWTTPPPEINQIREFLDAPFSGRSQSAESLWEMAATALGRLVGRRTRKTANRVTAAKVPTSPPPIKARHKSKTPEPAAPAKVGSGERSPASSTSLRSDEPPRDDNAPQSERTIELSGKALLPLAPDEIAALIRPTRSKTIARERTPPNPPPRKGPPPRDAKESASSPAAVVTSPDAVKAKSKGKWKSRRHRKSRQRKRRAN